jgi:hypothetical protein
LRGRRRGIRVSASCLWCSLDGCVKRLLGLGSHRICWSSTRCIRCSLDGFLRCQPSFRFPRSRRLSRCIQCPLHGCLRHLPGISTHRLCCIPEHVRPDEPLHYPIDSLESGQIPTGFRQRFDPLPKRRPQLASQSLDSLERLAPSGLCQLDSASPNWRPQLLSQHLDHVY